MIDEYNLEDHPIINESTIESYEKVNFKDQSSRSLFLIETHSEHLLRGIQVHIAKGNILKDDVAVYYIGKRKNGNGYVKEMKLTDTGLFEEEWPEGFLFEDSFNQSRELLKYQ